MTEIDRLEQLKQMLASDLIRKRQAGVTMASEMLKSGEYCEEVRKLLVHLIQMDPITIVQGAARKTLTEDQQRRTQSYFGPPQKSDDIFAAKCPNGHISYYNKSDYCSKHSSVIRRVVVRGDRKVDEILLKCTTCDEEFYAEVPCEGSKEP